MSVADIIGLIFGFITDTQDIISFRSTCRRAADHAVAIPRDAEILINKNIAYHGDTNRTIWAIIENRDDMYTISKYAGRGGHIDTCRQLLKTFRDPECYNGILCGAARGGHLPICLLARPLANVSNVNIHAIRGGHFDIAQLAAEWGEIIDINAQLVAAATGGWLSICEHLKKSGATDFAKMAVMGASEGHYDICARAIEWGANNYDEILLSATDANNCDICWLAFRCGACDFAKMARRANYRGNGLMLRTAQDMWIQYVITK